MQMTNLIENPLAREKNLDESLVKDISYRNIELRRVPL